MKAQKQVCFHVFSAPHYIITDKGQFSLPLTRLELTKSTILKELIELTNDEECAVRTAAIETLTELLSFLDNTTLKTSIVPLVQGVCNQAMSTGDTSLPVVARLLGRLCHELKGGCVTLSIPTLFVVCLCVCRMLGLLPKLKQV